ncbi:MAG: HlyD family efflux transporter periplasmic adaptor subunit [Parvibaculum sp.]|uniref:HlyD family efflux transporter periplasmic adaptor subunit n=1 Tax=Parvibaculum sp. TaxID=2024848 RepID=UPI002ABAAE54|nr:HlyD family efflux transporter periplasmic adaptor subunit [Parvibaculum sp.]MDZ4379980.1 HlyD family efflux transporter periplasmic adaptor subunit [Parvibaculum sp.]
MAQLGRYFLPDQPLHVTQRDDRNRLFAPTRGIVRQISVHTIGEVVAPGETLMTIVPVDADLEVEAFLLNRDKGFVHAAQEAEIKVEAFPFTKYGTVPGEVVDVSNNSVDDEKRGPIFPVRVAMERMTIRADGEDMLLTPGMSVTVEVKTGKRRVIEYILTPLLRYRDEAIRER